jgi:hypothetical protein
MKADGVYGIGVGDSPRNRGENRVNAHEQAGANTLVP